ncbi:MAG: CUB domain-containing protein, partial [Kangiellaceae bacterium]|nr:CUB domain-containing protein [Kangiellaceae bacterium]
MTRLFLAGCNGEHKVTGISGSIASHDGVGVTTFGRNWNCTWYITVPTGKRVHAWFEYFDLQIYPYLDTRLNVSEVIEDSNLPAAFEWL